MRCVKCGAETGTDQDICNECKNSVRVLSPEERENFEGITIVDTQSEEDSWYQQQDGPEQGGAYVKQIHLAPGGIFGVLLVAALLIGLVLLAFPIVVLIGVIAIAGWIVGGLFRR